MIDQLSMNLWVWSRPVDFRKELSLRGFCVLYIILSELLTKDVLECAFNLTYVVTALLFILVLKTSLHFVLIFNTTHKVGCWEYWCCLRWHNYDRWNRNILTIYFSDSSSRYHITHLRFLHRELHLRQLFYFFLFILFLIFNIYMTFGFQ